MDHDLKIWLPVAPGNEFQYVSFRCDRDVAIKAVQYLSDHHVPSEASITESRVRVISADYQGLPKDVVSHLMRPSHDEGNLP